jgi:histidinol-phosphate aminotransferase
MSYERDNIRRMAGYQWGEQPDDPDTIKLNTNENPYPPSPLIGQAMASLDPAALRVYPQPTAEPLRRRVADLHDLEAQNIIITNGGDEGLRLAMTTFVDPGQTFAMAEPSYSLYPVLAQIQDARLTKIPLQPDWLPPAEFAETLNAAGARLVCLVNPHAPSGTLMDVERIEHLAHEFNGVVLVDEAYVDFVDPHRGYNLMPLVRDLDNLLILRTFSKGYSLAGLRLGYLAGATPLIEPMLWKTRDSYNIDAISQALGLAALEDQSWASDNWERVREGRARLSSGLTQLGFPVTPSEANFLLAKVPNHCPLPANRLQQHLKARGILVRHFDSPILSDKLRITVGTDEQNQRLIDVLRETLGAESDTQ